jgi:hypothetical protein
MSRAAAMPTRSHGLLTQGLVTETSYLHLQPLKDLAEAPPFSLELSQTSVSWPVGSHCSEAGTAVVATVPQPGAQPLLLSRDGLLTVCMEAHLRCRKGRDLPERLANMAVVVRLVNVTARAVLARATLDLLQLALGADGLHEPALPLVAEQPSGEDIRVRAWHA